MKKAVLKNFATFTGKLQACSFIKKTPIQVFSSKYCKTFKNTYFEEFQDNWPRGKLLPLPTPKLTLTQTLTLTVGRFSSEAIVYLPPNPKTNPNLDQNPNHNQRAIFLGRQLSRYHFKEHLLLAASDFLKQLHKTASSCFCRE